MTFSPVLGQISKVRRSRCVYRCVCWCEGGGVRQRLVRTLSKGHGHGGLYVVQNRMESPGVRVKRPIVKSSNLLKVCSGCES